GAHLPLQAAAALGLGEQGQVAAVLLQEASQGIFLPSPRPAQQVLWARVRAEGRHRGPLEEWSQNRGQQRREGPRNQRRTRRRQECRLEDRRCSRPLFRPVAMPVSLDRSPLLRVAGCPRVRDRKNFFLTVPDGGAWPPPARGEGGGPESPAHR